MSKNGINIWLDCPFKTAMTIKLISGFQEARLLKG
jgi:hypothetical protein